MKTVPNPIVHQKQTHFTCASTTLAMLLGLPRDQVIKEFHAKYFNRNAPMKPRQYLESKELFGRRCYTEEMQGEWGSVYLISAPSLNFEGYMHSLILDLRDASNPQVFDPNKGRRGKLYYIPQHIKIGRKKLARHLIGYDFDLEFRDPENEK